MKLKNILLVLFAILYVSCANKEDFREDFQKIVVDYQKKFPLPNETKIKENHPNIKPIYIYNIYFEKEKEDTLFQITRYSSGVTKKFAGYGVYDKNILPTVVVDDGNLSGKIVINKIKGNNIHEFINSDEANFLEGSTPVYVYKIKNDNINLIRIDTVWENWD